MPPVLGVSPISVQVNFNITIDAKGEIELFGEAPPSVDNVIVAQHDLPVTALYDETNQKGLLEVWEPSDAQGDIKTQLANTDSSGNAQGGPDLSGAYQVACKALAQGLQAILCDEFDCSGVDPFSAYNGTPQYTMQRDFGRVALAYFAHHLFGHVDATAAITNDVAFVHSMLSTTTGGGQEDASGAEVRYAGWTKSIVGDVETWDASGNEQDANLALRLVEAIVAKGKDASGGFVISSVSTATADSLANIVKQVIRQDSSRQNNVDGSQRTRNQRQLLRFYPGDIIYMNINVKPPTVEVGGFNPNPNNVANPPSTTGMTDKSFTLKIRLTDPNAQPPSDPFVYTDGTKTVVSGYTGTIPSTLTIPAGVTGIADSAFLNATSLVTVILPLGLTTIGASAFKGCTALTTIDIPSTVTSIGNSAFEGCTSLTTVALPGTGTKALKPLQRTLLGTGVNPPARLFRNRSLYTKSVAPAPAPAPTPAPTTKPMLGKPYGTRLFSTTFSVIPIGAFKDCTALTTVTIPSGLLTIKESAFEGCTSLAGVTIPSGVVSIEQKAFKNTGLTSVSLPTAAGFQSISANTFEGCAQLTSVTIPTNVTSIGASAFSGTGITSITLPSSLLSIGASAFAGTGLTSVNVPAQTSVGTNAFDNTATIDRTTQGNRTIPVDASGNMVSSGSVILGVRTDDGISQISPADLSGFVFNMNGSNYGSTIYVTTNGLISFTTGISSGMTTLISSLIGIACNSGNITTNRIAYFRTTTDTYDIVTIQLWFENASTAIVGAEDYRLSSGQMQIRLLKSLTDQKQYVEITTNKGSNPEITTLGQWAVATGTSLVTASAITSASDMFPSSGTRSILFTSGATGNSWSVVSGNAYLDINIDTTNIVPSNQPKLNRNWAIGSVADPSLGSMTVRAVKTDSQNNVYVYGSTNNKTGIVSIQNIGANASIASSVTVNLGVNNNVLVKYNAEGIAQWALAIKPGTSATGSYQIATDASNNVYVTGAYNSASAVPLDNADGSTSGVSLPISSNTDAFVVKYTSNGTAQWATTVKGSSGDNGYGIATDASNNVYVTGTYSSTASDVSLNNADGTPSGISLPISSGSDVFVFKYNSNGTAQWATTVKGSGTDNGYGIATDASNNVYVTGSYTATTAVSLNNSVTLPISTVSGIDAFIVKYNSDGTAQWATTVKGSGADNGYGIATDASNNVYVTGSYTATTAVTLNNSVTLPNSTGGGVDVFIAKYNSDGMAQWATTVKGSGTDNGYGIATDASNNVYVTGSYNNSASTVSLNNNVSLPNSTSVDAFVIKYNSGGMAQWAATVKGSGTDIGYGIAIDASNNVYVTGTYTSTSDVSLNNADGTSSGISLPQNKASTYPYIVKYNTTGITQSASVIIPYISTFGMSYTCTSDSSGNIYVGGYYSSYNSPYFIRKINGTGQEYSTVALPSSATTIPYVIKYNVEGDVLWAAAISGVSASSYGYGIATDASNNVYITGTYTSTSTIPLNNADGTSSGISLPISSSSDVFVVKYTSNGTAQWATTVKGSSGDNGYGIATDASNNVYVTGTYSSTSPVPLNNADGTSSSVSLPISSSSDVFVVKYTSNGTIQWATTVKGSSTDNGYGIATDASNNVYITGTYSSTSAVPLNNADGSSSGISLPISSSSDVFVAKYTSNGTAQWVTTVKGNSIDYGYGIATDASNNVYITGSYSITASAVSLNNADGTSSGISLPISSSSSDAFVVKYTSDGMTQWATSVRGSSTNSAYRIATDASNNVYITGPYGGYATVYDATATGQSAEKYALPYGNTGGFIIKYNSSGVATAVSSTLHDDPNGLYSYTFTPRGVCVTASKVYVAGTYSLIYQKTPTSTSNMVLPSATDGSFLIKYDA